jgi:GDP-L-fucose synthase
MNPGASFDISIRDLAQMIVRETGASGQIVWDTARPEGLPRRKLDVISRAEQAFGFRAGVDFQTGLRRTIAWCREQRRQGKEW